MLVVLAAISIQCNGGAGSDPVDDVPQDSDSTLFRIAVLPTDECRPFIIAQQHGMFDTLGFTVRLDTFFSAMDADTALLGGHVQMLVTDSVRLAYLNTIRSVETIRPVIVDTIRLMMLTTPASRIKSTKSLKDKIVAVTRNSALDLFADQTMQAVHMKPEELNRPQINDISLRADMLCLAQYDGAILPQPYATYCTGQGAICIATMQRPLMRVAVRSSVLGSRKADVDKIVSAYWQAKELQE